jgi:hypothetical protein
MRTRMSRAVLVAAPLVTFALVVVVDTAKRWI